MSVESAHRTVLAILFMVFIGGITLLFGLYSIGLGGIAQFLWSLIKVFIAALWKEFPGFCIIMLLIFLILIVAFAIGAKNDLDRQRRIARINLDNQRRAAREWNKANGY